jgi:hypothetical protein
MRMAGHGSKKIRTAAELDRCLAALGSRPGAMEAAALSDHESDALVSAAGLRLIAGDAGVWSPPGLDDLARRAEGWIFGVA